MQGRNLEDSLFSLLDIYFFNNHKRVWVSFQNPNLKENLLFLDPHGLYWACNMVRGKRAMKERIRQAQRVFEGYIE